MATYDAGIVTAYGAAVRGGYTGTYEEFCAQQANYAASAAAVEQAKEDVQELVDSIPADYSQMSADVTQFKEDLTKSINGEIVFGEIVKNEYVVKSDGSFAAYTGWDRTGYVNVGQYAKIILSMSWSSEYNAFYDNNKSFIKAFTVGTSDTDISVPNNAEYMVLSNSASGIASLKGTYISKTEYDISVLKDNVKQINDGLHVLSAEGTPTIENSRVMHSGSIESSSASDRTDYILIPNGCDRVRFKSKGYATVDMVSFFNSSDVYISGVEATNSLVEGEVTIPLGAKKVILSALKTVTDAYIYIYSTDSITEKMETISTFVPSRKNVLVFGDSITDCCNLTVSNGITTAYSFRDPSNSYINAGGQTVNYYMWPFIFNKLLHCNELRNYARSGASYKDASRSSGEERQNLSYQINLAIADLETAGGAFVVDHFQPDIIIMAIGTNDGVPNDTPEQAYSKIVTISSGIDVDATLSALDRSKFCEAVLWANLMIRKYFVDSLYCVVLPIQRMSDDNPIGTLHDYIKEIAQRFGGAIIIDGAYDSGIVKSNNVISGLGATLKDGLHPNEVGQNMMARMIMSAVNNYYVDYTNMQ